MSPCPPEMLSKVNLMIRAGGLEFPMTQFSRILQQLEGTWSASAAFAGSEDMGVLPYTTFLFSDGIGSATARNRHIQRRTA